MLGLWEKAGWIWIRSLLAVRHNYVFFFSLFSYNNNTMSWINSQSHPPFLAEAVCCWDEPIGGEDRSATVQVAREEKADLPRPLPLHRVNSTHDTLISCGWIHLLHHVGSATSWGGHSDGCCCYAVVLLWRSTVCMYKKGMCVTNHHTVGLV